MAYKPRLLRHMSRFYWGWGWSSIYWVWEHPTRTTCLTSTGTSSYIYALLWSRTVLAWQWGYMPPPLGNKLLECNFLWPLLGNQRAQICEFFSPKFRCVFRPCQQKHFAWISLSGISFIRILTGNRPFACCIATSALRTNYDCKKPVWLKSTKADQTSCALSASSKPTHDICTAQSGWVKSDSIFWDPDLGSTFLRQDSEMTLPRGSVSDLPFSLKKSWELVCLRTARSLLQTLPRRQSQSPFSDRSRSQFLQWKRAVILREKAQTLVCLFLDGWSLPRCEGANLGVFNLGDWFLYTSSAGRCCPFAFFSASGV